MMYTFRPWTIRQYAGFSTAEESNAFYRRNFFLLYTSPAQQLGAADNSGNYAVCIYKGKNEWHWVSKRTSAPNT